MFLLNTKAVATDATTLEMLSAIIKNIEFKDIIDMLLVIYLVYKALQFLRDTRAMQLLKGVTVASPVSMGDVIVENNGTTDALVPRVRDILAARGLLR